MKRLATIVSLVALAFAGVVVSEAAAALPPNPTTHFGVGKFLHGKVVLRDLRNLGFRIVIGGRVTPPIDLIVPPPTSDSGVDRDENPPWTWTHRHPRG